MKERMRFPYWSVGACLAVAGIGAYNLIFAGQPVLAEGVAMPILIGVLGLVGAVGLWRDIG